MNTARVVVRRMQLSIVALLFLAYAPVAIAQELTAPTIPSASMGRWQVIPLMNSQTQLTIAVLLDTVSGQTWQLACVTDNLATPNSCEPRWLPLTKVDPPAGG
jgi:hypothetical protein